MVIAGVSVVTSNVIDFLQALNAERMQRRCHELGMSRHVRVVFLRQRIKIAEEVHQNIVAEHLEIIPLGGIIRLRPSN